ncbi:fish-egg lectin-like [Gadus macrocephalus]|uniref:fish-egg lectin-like n=1 Tax=Gadus macrocephalus TaxID=80720 RepID=UPI0028CBAFEE|nr:fish-egg lectin-like [Gadus macrocephalus]
MTAVVCFVLLLSLVAGSHAWRCVEGPTLNRAIQIDASKGQVVASTAYNQNFFLTGVSWTYLHGQRMKHITTGDTGTWGVTSNNQLYKMIGGNFTRVPGLSLSQVDAGGDGFLVGSTGSRAYCLRTGFARAFKGAGSVSWSALPAYSLKYYSCGLYGCWGVDTIGRVYHTRAVYSTNCGQTGWQVVSSSPKMKMVEAASNGLVFALSTDGKVYLRAGIYASRTQGTAWSNIPMCVAMRHLSYDLGRLWVVSNAGMIMFCMH